MASFVGYFPADNPKYACIVVVSAPTGDAYYGGAVAGPVFKDVADKVYSTSLEIHKEINPVDPRFAKRAPSIKSGSKDDVELVLKTLKVPMQSKSASADWVSASDNDSLLIHLNAKNTESTLDRGLIPDLTGMSAQDALYLLENKGIRVRMIGNNKDKPYAWSGAVVKQSIEAGTAYTKGTQIILELI